MEITDVKVIPVDDEKLKAFVSIVFDHCFVVTDIKVIHGPKGLFVSMPSKKRKDGTFKDIAHPLNNQMRQYLEERVLGVYKQQVSSGESAAAAPRPAAAAPPVAPTAAPRDPAPAAPAAPAAPPPGEPAAPAAPAAPSPATPAAEGAGPSAPSPAETPAEDEEAKGKEDSEG
jgi:stage V sporulation protein G